MPKLLLRFLLLSFLALPQVQAQNSGPQHWTLEGLKQSAPCLLEMVRSRMNSIKSSAPPQLRLESETPLEEFQSAMEKWWGFKPEVFLNVYDPINNQIFLMTQKASYNAPRTPFDSLVHELVHFVQVQDQGVDLRGDDFSEMDAVFHQTWFRDTYGSQIQNELYLGPCK